MNAWIVVCDFDGTISINDVGNELHRLKKPDSFKSLQADYRASKMTLIELQEAMWNNFPMGEFEIKKAAVKWKTLRKGANAFFEYCAEASVPVFIASCGIETYINSVLSEALSPKANSCIEAVEANKAIYEGNTILRLKPPFNTVGCPYPMNKGAWARKMRDEMFPHAKILAIGNGSSDKSFAGCVDLIAATDGLATWCSKEKIPHIAFESFDELLEKNIFQTGEEPS